VGVVSEAAPSSLVLTQSRSSRALPIAISLALVVPCFWQPIVSSVDLQSHLYNAWLAELIRSSSIHGLWIGRQSTNIVVDLLLSWLLKVVGVSGAERLVASILVLIFFWGAFRFVSAVRGEPAYWLAPWLAILSYGFVFQLGLLNYYLSCGIVLWLFAAVWGQPFRWYLLLAVPLLGLAYVAHPLPVLWFLGIAAYCWLTQRMPARFQIALFVAGVAALLGIRFYVVARYFTMWMPRQLVYWTGADQALLYGWLYVPVALGFLLFTFVLLGKPENGWRVMVSAPAQAYFLTAVAIVVIPDAIRTIESGWASFIAARLSLLSSVLLLAVLGRSTDRAWYLPAGLLTAAVFFGALYHDTGSEARVEAEMQKMVETLPAGERVVSYADLPKEEEERGNLSTRERKLRHLAGRLSSILIGRLNETHLLSRACLGHCFDYMNYEASTDQFRIHALPDNPVVLANREDVSNMMNRTYIVTAKDLPLYALLRCGPGAGDLLLRPMARGEIGAMLACPGTSFHSY
jgi:hypothetical protein